MRWVLAAAIAVVCLVTATAIGVAVSTHSFQSTDVVARNVSIAGVPVGGMRRAQALESIHQQWVPTLPKTVNLAYSGGTHDATPESLGGRLEIEGAVDRALRLGREGGIIRNTITRLRLWRSSVDIGVECSVDECARRPA